jgi:RNAse (barnase) inhibitor barstar
MESWWDCASPCVHHVTAREVSSGLGGSPKDAVIFKLRGSCMVNHDDLFDEFSREMSFPRYFGRNWPALQDCLDDLTWIPAASAYIIVIREWRDVLSECEVDKPVLERILNDVGAGWAQGPESMIVPFNTLLVSE